MIKIGSVWNSSDFKSFKVFDIVEESGNTWIHYHLHDPKKSDRNQPKYSCFEGAFLERFRENLS